MAGVMGFVELPAELLVTPSAVFFFSPSVSMMRLDPILHRHLGLLYNLIIFYSLYTVFPNHTGYPFSKTGSQYEWYLLS